MLDLPSIPDSMLDVISDVVSEVHRSAPELDPADIMVVGAACRDVLHAALGHSFATVATRDLDLALALSSWDVFKTLAGEFPRAGDTGIRYRIAGWPVDLLPFGEVEDPEGVVDPPTRREPVSVWAFEEIFAASIALELPESLQIRIPDVAGYAAAKLGAWLDRSEWGETKDATDLASIGTPNQVTSRSASTRAKPAARSSWPRKLMYDARLLVCSVSTSRGQLVRSGHASCSSAGRGTSNFLCALSGWVVVRHGHVTYRGGANSSMR